MSPWLQVFLAGISTPMIVIGVAGMLAFGILSIIYLINRHEHTLGTDSWADYHRGFLLWSKMFLISAVSVTIACGIPSPDFQKQIVTKVVHDGPVREKIIVKQPQMIELVNDCLDSARDHGIDNRAKCVEVAQKEMDGAAHIIYKRVPYTEIYNTCMGNWAVSDGDKGIEQRNERIKLCDGIATEKVKIGLAQAR